MSGPTTACLFCNKATPLVGCWGQDASGRIWELCKDCQPNRFVNPHYVNQAAAAHREALALERSPHFAQWEQEVCRCEHPCEECRPECHDGACRTCGDFSDWADGCSNGCL